MGRGGDLEASVRKVLPKDEQVRQSQAHKLFRLWAMQIARFFCSSAS